MYKPRLQRLKWLYTDHPVYFLTACAYRRRAYLANQFLNEAFVSYARKAADSGVAVGRYVMMPDHVHLFAAFSPRAPSLSEWMKGLKRGLSDVLSGTKVPVPHWQKGFFDHVMRSAESYEQKWLYVRDNPVRAGLVQRAEDWPYQGEIQSLQVDDL